MKNLMVTFLVMTIGMAQATSAYAANYQGTVSNVYPYNGMVYIVINGGAFAGDAGSCPLGSSAMVYSVDPNTAFGRALISVAISAKVSGLLVYAGGNGSCAGSNPFNGAASETLIGMDLKG